MTHRSTGRWPRAGWVLGWACLAAIGWTASCGSGDETARDQASRQALAALEAGDASAALRATRRGLVMVGDDTELLLLAGRAALELKRYSEAVTFAERGLPLADGPEQTGDLRWLQGKALLGRFRELHEDDDWRRANVALEPAVAAGSHRAEAAVMLVLLQDLSSYGDVERQRRFARELYAIAEGAPEAEKVRAYLRQRGVEP